MVGHSKSRDDTKEHLTELVNLGRRQHLRPSGNSPISMSHVSPNSNVLAGLWCQVPHSCLIISGTLVAFRVSTPHALLLHLRPALSSSVLGLQVSELSPGLRVIYSRQAHPQHLQANIPSQEPPPDVDCGHGTIVLVLLVDECPDPPMRYVIRKPVECLLREWLTWSSEVSQLGCINACQSYVDLFNCLNQRCALFLLFTQKLHTVLSFNSFLSFGTLLPGIQPQPVNLPPGVWNNRKLSPSPTLVTFPKRLLFLQKAGWMREACGMRLR